VLDYRDIAKRDFPDWSMAFVKLDAPPQFLAQAKTGTADHDKLVNDLQHLLLRNS
jgi:hypothetical protein